MVRQVSEQSPLEWLLKQPIVDPKSKIQKGELKGLFQAYNSQFTHIRYEAFKWRFRNLKLQIEGGLDPSWPNEPRKKMPVSNEIKAAIQRIKDGKQTAEDVAKIKALQVENLEPDIQKISKEEQGRIQREYDHKVIKELKKEKALTDALIAAVALVTPKIPRASIKLLKAPKLSTKPQTAVALVSDLHIGAKVDPDETGGLGHYNYGIFRQRLNRLQMAIRSITAHHKQAHPVKHLVSPLLGDLIENISIFGSQPELVDLDLMAQVLKAIEDLSEFYIGLLDTFETIFVIVLTGNHGRIGRKGEHKRLINWDYLIGEMLKMKLENHPRITVEVPKAPFAMIQIEGFWWFLRHGDQIKSWAGIPYYGLERSTGKWVGIMARQGKIISVAVSGHLHPDTPIQITSAGAEIIVNGSMVGTTEFSTEVMESTTRPSQFFGFVHPDHGLAARYPIRLDKD